ncbi:MAG: hypothetical protein B6244_10485 [Candidatus Cloacimonetes bacterium 4572_55]|nr:MAG: hypothetical protein B6244_10485 [Candidatus Cloacimonetes bacterium 4572_55]
MDCLVPIFDQYLSADGKSLRIVGFVRRDMAHIYGIPHAAVHVGVIIHKETEKGVQPGFLLRRRSSSKRVCPEMWDVFGSHVEIFTDGFVPLPLEMYTEMWDVPSFISRLFDDTALREVNEEVQILNRDFKFTPDHLHRFGDPGSFDYGIYDPNPINREFSTFYMAPVPKEALTISTNDSIDNYLRALDSVGVPGQESANTCSDLKLFTLSELMEDYARRPNTYADGIKRILIKLSSEPGTLEAFSGFLKSCLESSTKEM